MKIYISGISGTGMGPLALMAKQAGIDVCGSDLAEGAVYEELLKAGIHVKIGQQDGEFLKNEIEEGVDWFVHTSALPQDHAELVLAREAGIKITKRDELTAYLIDELGLKLVAVAGTHGKTTTTAMIAFAALKLGLPVSYIVGTTLGFAPSGAYHPGDKYFIYEADEYDRNFLKFNPWVAVLPFVSYDHPDIYPTREEYTAAFSQFKSQSQEVIETPEFREEDFKLAGEARRHDAALAASAVMKMALDAGVNVEAGEVIRILNDFPGVGRRFERLADGIYTDYAHHPEEIKATIDVARDEASLRGLNGVTVIYQPHQNTRQHEVKDGYRDAFLGANKVLWLPTYLTREDESLPVLTPDDLISIMDNKEIAESVVLGDELFSEILDARSRGELVILMTAGPADQWLRQKVSENNLN